MPAMKAMKAMKAMNVIKKNKNNNKWLEKWFNVDTRNMQEVLVQSYRYGCRRGIFITRCFCMVSFSQRST